MHLMCTSRKRLINESRPILLFISLACIWYSFCIEYIQNANILRLYVYRKILCHFLAWCILQSQLVISFSYLFSCWDFSIHIHFTFWRSHHWALFGMLWKRAKKRDCALGTPCVTIAFCLFRQTAPAPLRRKGTTSNCLPRLLWMCNLSLTRSCMRKDTRSVRAVGTIHSFESSAQASTIK